ncbi:MAG: response regulator [Deltaproteobacteria bacterium]|nr:response regulator [Deltaproteobacteria bacterium]
MKILIAEDDITSRALLKHMLAEWGYEVVVTKDGNEAWEALQAEDAPKLAILDWIMPGPDGVEVCRKVRQLDVSNPTYIILLTSRSNKKDIVAGLEAGADDYIGKPYETDELHVRVKVGERITELQSALVEQVHSLQEALVHVRTLQGILPICMHCHKIQNDQQSWEKLEKYISEHSDAQFSHGLCPECLKKHYPDFSTRATNLGTWTK